jgi:hypothetical protein
MPKQRSAVVRRVAVVGLAVLFWLASVSLPTAQAQSVGFQNVAHAADQRRSALAGGRA